MSSAVSTETHPVTDPLVGVHAGLFLLALVLMTMVNSAGAFPGLQSVPVLQWVPIYVPMMVALLGFGGWLWWRRDRSLSAVWASMSRPAWVCVLGATGLFCYALLSALLVSQRVWVTRFHVPTPVPKQLVAMPPVQALLTVWTAFVLVAIVPAERRFVWLWRLSVAMVPLTLLGWARVWLDDRSVRLWTQMGGAAVYPVVLILGFAVAVAGVLRQYRPVQSQVLGLIYLVLLLLTGSRGALVMVVAFVALSAIRLGRRHTGLGERLAMRSKRVYLMGGVLVVLAGVLSPVLSRIDLGALDHGSGRLATWGIGFRAAAQNVQTLLLGAGSGKIWPWYAFESGWQPIPWRSRVIGPFGTGLYHSHSVYVEVIGELGLVGLALLAVVVAPIVLQWIRGGSLAAMLLASATCACLIGFSVDSYLFKNFPVSLIWWLVAFGVLSAGLGNRAAAAGEDDSGAALTEPVAVDDPDVESARDAGGVTSGVTR